MAEKKPVAKGKSTTKGRMVSLLYEISGSDFKRKNKSCPKCGKGMFMANHKDRWTCGKCGFMEKK